MPTAKTAPTETDRYTYADYQELPEGAPYELIRGALIMSPSPSVLHQRLVFRLGNQVHDWASSNQNGEVLLAPMDVHLSDEDVLQPDVLFVSKDRADRIGTQEIEGAPDLVMEVVSPSTAGRDVLDKKRLYERHGVREYWIVDPATQTVEIWVKGDDGFSLHVRRVDEGEVDSHLLDGLRVDLSALFRSR